MTNEHDGEKFQSLVCKKCDNSNLYHLDKSQPVLNNWHRVSLKFGHVEAFEKGYDVPHWYICPLNPMGKDHREKIEREMGTQRQAFLNQQEEIRLRDKPTLQYGQKMLPSERLSEIDRAVAEKVHVIEALVDDIKILLSHKAAE